MGIRATQVEAWDYGFYPTVIMDQYTRRVLRLKAVLNTSGLSARTLNMCATSIRNHLPHAVGGIAGTAMYYAQEAMGVPKRYMIRKPNSNWKIFHRGTNRHILRDALAYDDEARAANESLCALYSMWASGQDLRPDSPLGGGYTDAVGGYSYVSSFRGVLEFSLPGMLSKKRAVEMVRPVIFALDRRVMGLKADTVFNEMAERYFA